MSFFDFCTVWDPHNDHTQTWLFFRIKFIFRHFFLSKNLRFFVAANSMSQTVKVWLLIDSHHSSDKKRVFLEHISTKMGFINMQNIPFIFCVAHMQRFLKIEIFTSIPHLHLRVLSAIFAFKHFSKKKYFISIIIFINFTLRMHFVHFKRFSSIYLMCTSNQVDSFF